MTLNVYLKVCRGKRLRNCRAVEAMPYKNVYEYEVSRSEFHSLRNSLHFSNFHVLLSLVLFS